MNSLSLNEITQNIINTMRGGRSSNTEHFSQQQIHFLIKYYRALLIRRDQQRNLNRSRMFEQDLGYVDLENIDSAESVDFNSAHTLKRTTARIPTPIRLKEKEAITYISSDGKLDRPIPLIDALRTHWYSYNKYTSHDSFAVYRDGFIYIINDITINKVNIRGIFEDPQKVFEFSQANGLSIYDENSPYPVPADMVEQITKAILSDEARLVIQTRSDTQTNLQPNQPQEVK